MNTQNSEYMNDINKLEEYLIELTKYFEKIESHKNYYKKNVSENSVKFNNFYNKYINYYKFLVEFYNSHLYIIEYDNILNSLDRFTSSDVRESIQPIKSQRQRQQQPQRQPQQQPQQQQQQQQPQRQPQQRQQQQQQQLNLSKLKKKEDFKACITSDQVDLWHQLCQQLKNELNRENKSNINILDKLWESDLDFARDILVFMLNSSDASDLTWIEKLIQWMIENKTTSAMHADYVNVIRCLLVIASNNTDNNMFYVDVYRKINKAISNENENYLKYLQAIDNMLLYSKSISETAQEVIEELKKINLPVLNIPQELKKELKKELKNNLNSNAAPAAGGRKKRAKK
jgi:hypothetical protein